MKEKVKSFSTEMRQRLYLAATLLSKPSFVILDEPTNVLDSEGKFDLGAETGQFWKVNSCTFLSL